MTSRLQITAYIAKTGGIPRLNAILHHLPSAENPDH